MRDLLRPSRLRSALLLVVLLSCARSASAQVQAFEGRTVTDVKLVIEGRATTEADLLDLVETRVGTPLDLQGVRETIVHLMALSRFENVLADAQAGANGVVLVYNLVPLRTIRAFVFRGSLGLSRDVLKSEVTDRYGTSPPLGRAGDIAATLETLYRDHGYQSPRITPQPAVESSGPATLTFDIDPGPRARIGTITIKGDGQVSPADVLKRLDVKRGGPWDPFETTRRASAFAASLRAKGFYTASIDLIPRPSEDGNTVNLDIEATRGLRVVVQFTGDHIPSDRAAALVPIKQENAVDQDLLEDWSGNIERYLQAQGYKDARVNPSRATANGEQRVIFDVRHGARHVVGRIDVTNAVFPGIPREEALRLFGVQPGQPFVERQVAAGVSAITARYQSSGFMTPHVQAAVAPHGASGGEVVDDITLDVAEGPRTLVTSIKVFVNGVETAAAQIPGLTLTASPGRPFFVPEVDADRERLLASYVDRGYQMASVAPLDLTRMLSADRTQAEVRFDVRTGERVVVDHILLVGNNRTKASTIRDALTIKPGDPLSLEQLNESQQRLTALGLFRRVRISQLQHATETHRDVLVVVEEAPATSLAYSVGVEGAKRLRRDASGNAVTAVELAPRAGFEIGRRNLWGKNRSISFSNLVAVRPNSTDVVGAGLWEYQSLAAYREPGIFNNKVDLLVTGGVEQTIRTSYSFSRRSAYAEVAHRLSPKVSLYGRYSLERTHVFNEQVSEQDQLLIDKLFPKVRISKVSASLVRDTRDDPIDPSTGLLATVDGDLAPMALGSEVGFTKGLFQAFVFRKLPTTRRIVFAGGARLGLATGFDQIVNGLLVRDVPISERFFSGNTVRGFVEDRLGMPATLTPEGFPLGGNGLLILNGELRVSVWKDLASVLFVDAGNVYALASDVNLGDIRPSLGFGLRYKSPIGPIRIDLGFNPSRHFYGNGTREPLTSVYFGIGQAF